MFIVEPSKIYLCKSDKAILGSLTGLKSDTCILKKNVASPWELTFEVDRYTDDNGTLVQSDYYDSIDELMKLYLDTEDEQVFFVINSEPKIHGEGSQEYKSVIAHSEECELRNIPIKNFKVNCGTKDSQEYLATDANGNFNNINTYTGLPNEYISLVNYENEQLSLLHLVLQNTGWIVKQNISPDVCQLKGSFDIESDDIYTILMNIVSPTLSVIFEFDRKHKQIGITKVEDYGEDTGIFITMRNLMNSFDVSSSSDDSIITKLVPVGANNLDIGYVNFGSGHIINLDHFMGTLNEYGDYKYVSEELHNKYILWKNYRDSDKVEYDGKEYTRRELYAELTRLYNRTILDISGLKNRVPNDGTIIDYTTYSYEDLKLSLTAYNNALNALVTLYKNEYGVTEIGESPDYLPVPSSAVNIKDTPYWYDFYAYKEKIIPQVIESLKMYCKTDQNGNLMVDSNGAYIKLESGNPDYYVDKSIVKNFDSYLYEWSLYGLDELEAKKKAWSESANILFNECFIKSGSASSPTEYLTADKTGWDTLTQEQKGQFTTQKAFIDKLNRYLDYMSFSVRDNSLTKTKCNGIIRQCEDAIKTRNDEILSLMQIQGSYNTQRAQLSADVALSKFFSDKEMNVVNSMLREKEYTNDNILTTNLDDIVSTVDVQEELYQCAVKELYKLSQPQYSFRTEIDNIYALDEFKPYHEQFRIGNFIRVGCETHEELYDNNFIKLRLISITYNPLMFDEEISIEFSTMQKSIDGINDLSFLISSENTGSRSGSSGSSSSGAGGTYGNNDANVQISNNMLNALLSTELFGTTVNDVILDSIKANKGNFNLLLSHSGIFDSLEAGQIKVSGDCLFDHIKSNNYVDGKSGSMLNLSDGSFSFASGALTYDPRNGLTIKGFASESSVNSIVNGLSNGTTNVNGGCISTGNIKSNNWNGSLSNPLGNTQGSILQLLDGKFNLGGGKLKWDGTNLLINGNGKFTGEIQGTSGTFNGAITATTLTANQSGNIAGWTFNQNGFYKTNSNIAASNGMYLGNDGMSIKDYFVVKQEGMYIKSKDWVSSTFRNEIGTDGSLLCSINQGQWIKIYMYNVDDIDYFEMSWRYSLEIDMGGVVNFSVGTKYYIGGYGVAGRTEQEGGLYVDGDNIITFVRKFEDLYKESDYSNDPTYLECKNAGYKETIYFLPEKFYSMGRTINGKYFNSVQIGKIEIYNSDNTISRVIYGTPTNKKTGMMINTFSKHIYADNFSIGNEGLSHSAIYNLISSGSSNLCIDSNGTFKRSSSSSKRYKTDITNNIPDDLSLEKLYDLNVVSFKYKDNYLSSQDSRYKKTIIGFLAEDIYEKYPLACNLDEDGNPEMWNINILFPAALKLIQNQHNEIEAMKEQFQILREKLEDIHGTK